MAETKIAALTMKTSIRQRSTRSAGATVKMMHMKRLKIIQFIPNRHRPNHRAFFNGDLDTAFGENRSYMMPIDNPMPRVQIRVGKGLCT